ncbi:MAG: DNA cytosine methyltransferase [Pirellula sp.]
MKTLELYAGIGGLSAACPWLEIVHAVDINADSRDWYQLNFDTPYALRELQSVPAKWLEEQRADLWWMSPPCTPYTRRGNQNDSNDPRAQSFLHLIDCVQHVQPPWVVVENVVGFESSRTHGFLKDKWEQAGYRIETLTKCPTELGWPMRRPRIYVVASRSNLPSFRFTNSPKLPLHAYLDSSITRTSMPELWLDDCTVSRYLQSLHRIDPTDPDAIASCFASSYGKVFNRAGSYLLAEGSYRRFSPREVANLLGFSSNFQLAANLKNTRMWQLLGNSLSLPVIEQLLHFTRATSIIA